MAKVQLSVLDGRRVLIHKRNSLYQDVLDRLGIENAWTRPSGPYGHATVTMDRLAGLASFTILDRQLGPEL